MKGLALCEAYYHEVCAPMLRQRFPALVDRIAAGLVGDGSECFGYDDELSQDHDFGPGVMLWLTGADFYEFGRELQAELDRLPQEFAGFQGRKPSAWGAGRTGVHPIGGFYARFIRLDRPPETLDEWRRIPETALAAATNGRVFADPLGEFTRFREALLAYYPEDVRLKKMAARCMRMAQAGQYNYPRCVQRNEPVAAWLAAAEFIEAASSLIFLLNRRYMPFYKWTHRALGELPLLGQAAQAVLAELVSPDCRDRAGQIEWLCGLIVAELQWQGLSGARSDFLLDHGPALQNRIRDARLRGMSPWVE